MDNFLEKKAGGTRKPPSLSSKRKWLFRILALSLGVLVGELLLTLGASFSPRLQYYMSPPWSRAVIPDPVLGKRMSPFFPEHDRWGYRNDRTPDRCDILAIGDSITYGYAATSKDSWPRQLEALSGRVVYNAGVGSYGPCEYDIVLDEFLFLKPSTVVIALYVGNDIANAYSSVYPSGRFPHLRSQDEAVFQAMQKADRQATLKQLSQKFSRGVPDPSKPSQESFFKKTSLYSLGRGLHYYLGVGEVTEFDEDRRGSFEEAARRPGRLAYDGNAQFRTVFRNPEIEALAVDESDVRIQEGRRITETVLLSIQAKLRREGIRLIIAVWPNKSTLYADFIRRSHAGEMPRSFFRLVELEEQLTHHIVDFLTRNQIEFVEVLPALRSCFVRGVRPYPESDDHHPNATGYRAVAETILSFLNSPSPKPKG